MKKHIGKVSLNYKYYMGTDLYSDGKIEDLILESCIEKKETELLKSSTDYAVLYHLSPIRTNLLEWIDINKEESVLEIGSGCGALTGILSTKAKRVTCVELSEKRSLINAYRNLGCENVDILLGNFQDIEPHLGKFDVITLIGVLEYAQLYIDSKSPFIEMLSIAKQHLSDTGRIIIAIENKMGLKYWNGAFEDHIGKQYCSINNYTDDLKHKVRTFSKPEIKELLSAVEIKNYKFYYPLPDYKLPFMIYSDEYLPKMGDIRLFGKEYAFPRMYNFNEAIVNDQICEDGMFDYFANSFLVVCGEKKEKTIYAKYNCERKRIFRTRTTIEKDAKKYLVRKRGLEVDSNIKDIVINSKSWSYAYSNIKAVPSLLDGNSTISAYVDGVEVCSELHRSIIIPDDYIKEIKKILNKYFNVDEHLKEGIITKEFIEVFGNIELDSFRTLKVTNIDLIPGNIKINKNGEWEAYDSEWVFSFPIPYRFVEWRFCKVMYDQYRAYLKNIFSRDVFLEKIGFSKAEITVFDIMENNFTQYVVGKNHCEEYTKRYQKTVIMQNLICY